MATRATQPSWARSLGLILLLWILASASGATLQERGHFVSAAGLTSLGGTRVADVLTGDPVGPQNSANYSLKEGFAPTLKTEYLRITLQPMSRSVASGGQAQFSVAAVASGALSFQWRRGGMDLPGETGPMLTVTSVGAANAGNYEVVVTSGRLSVVSDVAVLSLNDVAAPKVTRAPQSQVVLAGGSHTFGVRATGDSLSYRWKKAGTPLGSATERTLVVLNASSSDAGAYSVEVENAGGQTESPLAFLGVVDRMVEAGHVTTQNLSPGSQIDVPVQLTGLGDERGVRFSLNYDPAVLSFASALTSLGGAQLTVMNDAMAGAVAVEVLMPMGQFIGTGISELVVLTFEAGTVSGQSATRLDLGDLPLERAVLDADLGVLASGFAGGGIVFQTATPAPDGGTGLIVDSIQIGPLTGPKGEGLPRLLVASLGTDSSSNPISLINADGINEFGMPFILLDGKSQAQEVRYLVPNKVTVPTPTFLLQTPAIARTGVPPQAFAVDTASITPPNVGGFTLRFNSEAGVTYYVQYRDRDPAGLWRPVFPPLAGTGSIVEWTDSGPPATASTPDSISSRFYQIVRGP